MLRSEGGGEPNMGPVWSAVAAVSAGRQPVSGQTGIEWTNLSPASTPPGTGLRDEVKSGPDRAIWRLQYKSFAFHASARATAIYQLFTYYPTPKKWKIIHHLSSDV